MGDAPAPLPSTGTYRPLSAAMRGELDISDEDFVWQDRAACKGADADLFFPERGASTREAKRICKTQCEVRA